MVIRGEDNEFCFKETSKDKSDKLTFKDRALFWTNPKLETKEIKMLIILKIIGGVAYFFLFLETWIPWLSISVKNFGIGHSYAHTSYHNLLKEMGNMYGIFLILTIAFIFFSAVLFGLGLVKIAILCIILTWMPKLLLILMLFTDSTQYRYFPSYGMILGIISFFTLIYTAFKSRKILRR